MPETAVILCEGHFAGSRGKTAHGLARHSSRFDIVGVLDSTQAGKMADDVCEGAAPGIPIVADLDAAPADWLIIGVAPDGGVLPREFRATIARALERGMSVASGMHEFLADDEEFAALAATHGGRLVDVRRPPEQLHFFANKIGEVDSFVIAVLGTDACIGKRTTTILLAEALNAAGLTTAWVGTGQTAWLQGARYSLRLDALVNDFVAGEIEHAVHAAWSDGRPDVILVEGQGSLTHPAYPGGFEILGAARPNAVILQHAPGRSAYEGFPDFPLAPPQTHIEIIRLMSGIPVLALTINAESLDAAGEIAACRRLAAELELPTCNPLREGCAVLVDAVRARLDGTHAR